MMTNPFAKFPNQPTDHFFERLGGSTLRNPATTATFEDDFNTNDWDDAGTRFGVNTTTEKFDFDAVNDGTNDASVYDLGSGNVSDTAWVLRAELNFSTISYGEDCFFYIVLSGSNQSAGETTNQKFIGTRLMTPNNATKRYDTVHGTAGHLDVLADNQYYTFLENTPYFVEIIRTGSNTFTVEIFTGSFGGTSLGKISTSGISGVTGLQFIKFANRMSGGGSGQYTGTVDNVEFYNGVTSVESESPSIKQHFIEWFSGKQLPSYWNYHDISGTGTKGMVDDVDGGYFIKSGGGNGTHSKIDFNDKRQYSPVGSNVNWVHKTSRTDNGVIWFTGFGYDKNHNEWSGINHQAVCFSDSDNGVFKLRTENASSYNDTATTISIDTSYHSENIVCRSTGIDLKIDGTTGATNTTALPTVAMQPIFVAAQRGSDSPNAQHNVIYCEVYNT